MNKNLVKTVLILLTFLGLSMSNAIAESTYVITGSGTKFTCVKDGTNTVASEKPIQDVINAIKFDAQSNVCIIQFGNGNSTLDIGTAGIGIYEDWYDPDPYPWGNLITLTGKLTSAKEGVIIGMEDTTIENWADITASNKGTVFDVYQYAKLIIKEGTITSTNGIAVANYGGELTINGATVQASGSSGIAIYSDGQCLTTIKDGSMVTSENTNTTKGTIYVKYGDVNINGGMVRNTATDSNAIRNDCDRPMSITGGIIEVTTGLAVWNFSAGTLTISGGNINATGNGGRAVRNESTGTVNISGGTVTATTGTAVENHGDGTVNIIGGIVLLTGDSGWAIASYNKGTVNISGGTVTATTATAIISTGTVNISGGTVSTTTGITIGNHDVGTVTITGGLILAKEGHTIFHIGSAEKINISGGIVFAYGTADTDIINGDYTQSGDAVLVAWNKDAGHTTYEFGTSDDIFKFPVAATAIWAKESSSGGISVDYNTTKGFIPIEGVTITGVGIETVTSYELQVYPNPTSGELKIATSECPISDIQIYDVVGKLVGQSKIGQSEIEMNISHLPVGIYFLRIQTENGVITRKIIKYRSCGTYHEQ
ncbi:MAG: T9SS type A sorting domain-containing protein [Bacteroidales bacterium]|jgi:hypothetical protein|nr:T9SS type A sorting domain-containing protein [Bacteroidales bacterium]